MGKRRGRNRMDEDALFESKKLEAEESLERLKEAGTIKEAGVVFSHEGMKLFSQLFENTMRRVVREEIERSGKEAMSGVLEGLIRQAFPIQLPAPQEEPEEVTPPPPAEEKPMPSKRKLKGWTKEEDDHIVSVVREMTAKGCSVRQALKTVSLKDRTAGAVSTRYYTYITQKGE